MHGAQRVASGFHINDIFSEYRALRASVLRLWRESLPQPQLTDIDDLTRFNEALDQSLASGVASYSKRIDQSRQMFLAILSHDLRNPLSTVRTAAHVVAQKNQDRTTADAISVINRSTDAMMHLISDLIDFSSSGLGRAMPLHRELVDMEALCREVIDSYRTTHPGRVLSFHSDGDVNGVWDVGRIRQVISNLIGNALQHGSPKGPVVLSVTSKKAPSAAPGLGGPTVVLSVHNEGPPIPTEFLPTMFDPLKRYSTQESAAQRTPGSIGLGLYIVREIVAAKGGTISVTSTAEEGTTFTVCIPQFLTAGDDSRDDAKAARAAMHAQ
jgi:signal transduction histidine kinase